MTSNERRLQLPTAPEEGWLSLVLVGLMAFVMAMAIDDAGWVLGDQDLTDFLGIATLGGLLAGFIGAKVGWNKWVGHALGATLAALLVPLLVGEAMEPGRGLAAQFVAAADDAAQAWRDLVILQLEQTRATGHHLLILGLLCWGTAQFAASAVFRHHRPLSAVAAVGAFLVVNMAATTHEQLIYLIVFSLASLFLLSRLHALDEQATWARRRIGDPTAVKQIYLRGGAVFIALAVLGSLTLTATARSQPLAGVWQDVKPWLLDVSAAIQRYLPTLQDSRGIGGVRFGPHATIVGRWTSDGGLAMTVRRTPGDNFDYYWRAVAYDTYTDDGWEWTGGDDTVAVAVEADQEILSTSLYDRAGTPGTKDVSFTVTPNDLLGSYAVSPLTPLSINRSSVMLGAGQEGFFQALEISGREPYTITARVRLVGDEGDGLTENRLRAAGQNYPPELKARYLQLTPGAVGPEAQQVLDDVLLKLEANGLTDNPYDVAAALVRELQNPARFDYDPTVLDMHAQCGELSISECFATYRRGYCEHYATLMTVLLRAHKIPARLVEGFLPGSLDERTGVEEVRNSGAHAWVEAYFPGIGWVSFDPTGGNVSQAAPLPSGRVVPTAPPSRFPSLNPFPLDDDLGSRSPGSAGLPPRTDGGIGPGGYLLIITVLLVTVALIAFLIWRRGPRGPLTPEGAWTGIGRLAARFGFGPRPTQTAYEYATALGEVLPAIRPQLETVATAKVEVAYGGRVLGDDRLAAIRDAYTKLRVGLLRLLFRRGDRKRR